MSWFPVYKETYNSQTSEFEYNQINIPLKRIISINNLKSNVSQDEQIYVNLDNIKVNSYINSSLQKVTDDYSYLVVYEDYTDDEYFVPVQSTVVNNVLYFKAVEPIEKETISDRYYAVYYGTANLKYMITTLNNENENIYVRPDTLGTAVYDLSSYEQYTVSVDETTSDYSLGYYNSGTDWINGVSKKIGAKAYGIFDGPRLKIVGSKGRQYGKFKINIYPYTDQIIVATTQEFIIDCYSTTTLDNQTLFEKQDLDYKKYIFEIETISDKNIMSLSNDVRIDKYMFNPDYGLTYEEEKINPSLSFVKISGVR